VTAGVRGARDVDSVLGAYRLMVENDLEAVVAEAVDDAWMRGAIGYHLGWADDAFRRLPPGERVVGGKRMRAALALLAYEAATHEEGRDPDLGVVLPFATAVELFHSFTLVHDDLQDGDRLRWGRPTLGTVCGPAEAINVGDCLHALATGCIGRLRTRGVDPSTVDALTAELSRTAVELAVGQHHDLAFEEEAHVSVDRYLGMICRKTATLLRFAAYGGARLAAGPAKAAPYAEFGTALGLSFQIRDDVLGIWGTEAVTGKPAGRDIRRKKKTLPVVFALAGGAPQSDRMRSLYARHIELSAEEEAEVRQLLDEVGAIAFAQDQAQVHHTRALAALAAAARVPDAVEANRYLSDLRHLADFATERRF